MSDLLARPSADAAGATNDRRRARALLAFASIFAICAAIGWGATYNLLVRLEERAEAQWRQVQNQLDRRRALVPAITELARAAVTHEGHVLAAVSELRARASAEGGAATPMGAARDDAQFDRTWVVLEAVPAVRTAPLFLDLKAQLAGTESRLATERRRYNAAAREFNTRLRTIPYRFFALGFEPISYYGADRREAPREVRS